MRKSIALWICVLALLFGAGAAAAQEPVHLVFLGRDGTYEAAMKVAIAAYEKAHPNVTVEYLGLPWSGLREKITVELVEGRGDFDLIILDDPWTSEFLPAGFLENLDPWFESTGKKLSDDFIASLLALGRWPYPEGSQYALPIVGNVQLFAYRRDLFEAHGLEHPPATWTDVVAAAEKFAADGDAFGVVFRGARGNDIVVSFLPILWAFGGDIIVDGQSGVNSPEFLAALKLFLELKKYAPGDVDTYQAARVRELLMSGQAAMAVEVWPAWVPELDDPAVSKVVRQFELVAHPGEVKESAPMLGPWLVGINAKSKNKAVAFDFLTFVTSPEIQKMAAVEVGNPPTLASLYTDPVLVSLYRWYPDQLEALKSGVARPRTPLWSRVEDTLAGYLHEALVGIRSPEEAMEAAHQAISRILR
ncbi:MAG: ABC transporter substrate-binding protein [Limnochordia bacterium]|jgi:multiple sugar transport system substrate-binding protein